MSGQAQTSQEQQGGFHSHIHTLTFNTEYTRPFRVIPGAVTHNPQVVNLIISSFPGF